MVKEPRKHVSKRAAPPEQVERPLLARVLDNLGPSVAEVIVAPKGLDVPVTETVIYDPVEDAPIDPGAIVLAVGTMPDSADAARLIAAAGRGGAAACLFKLHGRACTVGSDAETAGVALVSVVDEMSWMQLSSLLAHALHTPDQSLPVGMAGVPMGDLFALANAIAGMVGGAVTIEDPRGRVLSYSNLGSQRIDQARRDSILGRQVPDTAAMRAVYRKLWNADGVLHIDRVEGLGRILPRLAVPVRAGDDTIGSIWVIADRGLDGNAEQALQDAARIAAVHMIHTRASRDFDRRVRGDLLRSLLEGRGSLESAAARLAIEPDTPLSLLAFELTAETVQEELYRERLVDLVSLYCEAFRRKAVSLSIGRTVYALLPNEIALPQKRLTALASEILDHAEGQLRTPLHGAVAPSGLGLSDLPRARMDVDRALQVLAADPKGRRVATVDDVRSRVILIELREVAAERPSLKEGVIGSIAAHDTEHGTAYVDTLRAYLNAFGSVPAAARLLGVHANTFRYRLRRMLEVFGLDLEDPVERLVIGLQLHLLTPGG